MGMPQTVSVPKITPPCVTVARHRCWVGRHWQSVQVTTGNNPVESATSRSVITPESYKSSIREKMNYSVNKNK